MQLESLISMLPAIYYDNQINYFRQLRTAGERGQGAKNENTSPNFHRHFK